VRPPPFPPRKPASGKPVRLPPAKQKSLKAKHGKMDVQLSNEQVALRAYFIGERRRKLGFPGDETSDWVEAKREISEELKGLVKEPAARGRRPV